MLVNILQNTISSFRSASSTIITDGLKMWLGFKTSEISGANQITPDLSGNSNVGKLFTGKALDFNGSTDSVVLSSDITLTDEFTIAFNIYKSTDGIEMVLGNTTLSNKVGYLNNGKYFIRVVNGGSSDNTISFDLSQWSRVVITRDSSNKVDISINGSSKVRLFSDSAQAGNSVWNEFGTSNGIQYLNGNLSDLQIYNKAWTAEDIAFDYNNPNHLAIDNPDTDLVVTNLKGYWALSEGAGSIAYDSSGEGNNGTINGATYVPAQETIPQLGMMDYSISTPVSDEVTLVANPSNPSQDILGTSVRLREHAFNLDGSGYAEVADDASLDFGTGAFSCDGWVKFKYVNTSSINCIYSNGGQIDVASNFGIGVTSNKIVARVSSTALSSSTTFSEGEWVYFALTRDGSGACKLYINDDTTPEGTASDAGSVSNSLEKRIGRDSSVVRFYQNLIDDVRVYNIELTSDEVENNYKAGLSAHSAGSSFSDDFSGDYGN